MKETYVDRAWEKKNKNMKVTLLLMIAWALWLVPEYLERD